MCEFLNAKIKKARRRKKSADICYVQVDSSACTKLLVVGRSVPALPTQNQACSCTDSQNPWLQAVCAGLPCAESEHKGRGRSRSTQGENATPSRNVRMPYHNLTPSLCQLFLNQQTQRLGTFLFFSEGNFSFL